MNENAVATNKQAFREYDILQRFEAGQELKGSEVKAIRAGKVNLKDSFARIDGADHNDWDLLGGPAFVGEVVTCLGDFGLADAGTGDQALRHPR